MAKLYIHDHLVATSDVCGVLGEPMRDGNMVITYPYQDKKYYTIIIYDDNDIHSLRINVIKDNLNTGDVLVDYKPFHVYLFNYDVIVYIYEQDCIVPIPSDDFDMDDFVKQHHLVLMYKMELLVLQKIEFKPNLFSNRYLNQKLKRLRK